LIFPALKVLPVLALFVIRTAVEQAVVDFVEGSVCFTENLQKTAL
jgi:hypothetical protein